MERLRTVLVVGDGKCSYPELSEPVGKLLAQSQVNLLTGAGGGVMAEVSKFFVNSTARRGKCLGVVPSKTNSHEPKDERYPNEFVEVPIYTHLGGEDPYSSTSRNHVNVLTADGVVALPGKKGTLAEINLAITYGVPRVAFLGGNQIPGLPKEVEVVDLKRLKEFVRELPKRRP
ncbi:hypothetical protein [Mesorhizobium sp. M1348]|uniref:SLOG cluster 4 domain-containing protein n=1 Tax=unclassified Mesorhizobium TaxID=325217 RepID=UPI00333610F6